MLDGYCDFFTTGTKSISLMGEKASIPLILSSLTAEKIGHLPQFKWMEILATVPTVIVAFKSKNLLYAVIVGIISMALIRFVF